MNWFRDMAMLFGEWLLIMLIALLIGVLIGWLLWRRKWRKAETEKATITRELNTCRSEKDSIAISRTEEMQAMKLKLEDCRKSYEEKLEAKGAEADKWQAEYNECLRDNEGLDADYKRELVRLKEENAALTAKISDMEADQKTVEEKDARIEAMLAEISTLKGELEKAEAEGKADIDRLAAELERAKATDRIKGHESDPEDCRSKKHSDSPGGEQISLDLGPEIVSRVSADEAFAKHLEAVSQGMDLNYEDDLKEISGVGPKMEKILKDFGVRTFYQLSKFEADGVAALNAKLAVFPGRIQRDNWVGQAKELHDKHHGE